MLRLADEQLDLLALEVLDEHIDLVESHVDLVFAEAGGDLRQDLVGGGLRSPSSRTWKRSS